MLYSHRYAEFIHSQEIGERIGLVGVETVERKAYIKILKRLGTRLPILVGRNVVQCAHLLAQIRAVIKIDKIGADKALLVQYIHHTHDLRKIRAIIVIIRAHNHRTIIRRNEFERCLNRKLLAEKRTLCLLVGLSDLVVQFVRQFAQTLVYLIDTRNNRADARNDI